jgi:hypothetical protein
MIVVTCENCGQTLHIQEEEGYQPVYCQYCNNFLKQFPDSGLSQQSLPLPVIDSLTVKEMLPMWRRPISAIFGRINAPFIALLLGTTAPFKSGPGSMNEDIRQVFIGFIKGNSRDRLELQLGSSRPLRNIVRIWRRNGLRICGKLIGTLFWPLSEIMRAIGRLDCYDPFAHTVVLYHRDPAILTHELGHAQDFAKRKWLTLYILARLLLPVLLYQEFKASSYGIINLRQRGLISQAKRANRVLCGGLGSYVGSVFRAVGIILGALIGQAVGAIFRPFNKFIRLHDDRNPSEVI